MKLGFEFLSNRSHAVVFGFLLCVTSASTQSAVVMAMTDETNELSSDAAAQSEDWRDLLMDDHVDVREDGLGKAPEDEVGLFFAEHGSRFVRDESRSIRFFLASLSRDADVLAVLAGDPDYLVRSNALANFATPVNVLTAAVDRVVEMSHDDMSDSAFHEFLSGRRSSIESTSSTGCIPNDVCKGSSDKQGHSAGMTRYPFRGDHRVRLSHGSPGRR